MNDIDSYILQQSEFAQPILHRLRAIIHSEVPLIDEAIKWRQPTFSHYGLVCAMAAFKNHVSFSFFQGKHIDDPKGLFVSSDNSNLAVLKFSSIEQLPEQEVLADYIKRAAAFNTSENKPKATKISKDKSTLVIPHDLQCALNSNMAAAQIFESFSYSKQKDYIEWIDSAKRSTTKESRVKQAVEWISEGKGRNWKYEKC